jgi:hypothetical protein
MAPSEQPINLVSVNTAPERAKRLIGILIEDVKDRYNIRHAANSESKSRGGLVELFVWLTRMAVSQRSKA